MINISKFNVSVKKFGQNPESHLYHPENHLYQIEVKISFADEDDFRVYRLLDMFKNHEISIFPSRLTFKGIIPLSGLKVLVAEKRTLYSYIYTHYPYARIIEDTSNKGPYIYPLDQILSPDFSEPYKINCLTEKDAERLIKPLEKGLSKYLEQYFHYGRARL